MIAFIVYTLLFTAESLEILKDSVIIVLNERSPWHELTGKSVSFIYDNNTLITIIYISMFNFI